MVQKQSYRFLVATALLVVMLAASFHQVWHRMVDSHCHENLKLCELALQDDHGAQHLHDAHYLTESCDLCDYLVQSFCLPEWLDICLSLPSERLYKTPAAPALIFAAPDWQTPALRGPPVFFS